MRSSPASRAPSCRTRTSRPRAGTRSWPARNSFPAGKPDATRIPARSSATSCQAPCSSSWTASRRRRSRRARCSSSLPAWSTTARTSARARRSCSRLTSSRKASRSRQRSSDPQAPEGSVRRAHAGFVRACARSRRAARLTDGGARPRPRRVPRARARGLAGRRPPLRRRLRKPHAPGGRSPARLGGSAFGRAHARRGERPGLRGGGRRGPRGACRGPGFFLRDGGARALAESGNRVPRRRRRGAAVSGRQLRRAGDELRHAASGSAGTRRGRGLPRSARGRQIRLHGLGEAGGGGGFRHHPRCDPQARQSRRAAAAGAAVLPLQRVAAAVRGVPRGLGQDAGLAARPVRSGARRDPRRGRQGRRRIRESRDRGDPHARRSRGGAEAVIPEPARKIMKRLGKWLGPHKAIEIVEEDGVRVLQIGGNAIQSAMRLDSPDRIELDYVRAMMAFLLFHPSPRDVLLVGLGGGSMARFIHQRMLQTRVTVVEIDPGVVTAARRYFHFPEEDSRLEIVIGDGAEAVPQRPASCDVLVLDGFVNGSPARILCTRSFYDGAFAALRPGGVMVANFMSDDKRIETHCGRIAESFGRGPTLLLAEEEDNYVAFALRGGPPRIRWTQLKARARAAQRLFDLPLEDCLADLRRRNSHTTRYLTL